MPESQREREWNWRECVCGWEWEGGDSEHSIHSWNSWCWLVCLESETLHRCMYVCVVMCLCCWSPVCGVLPASVDFFPFCLGWHSALSLTLHPYISTFSSFFSPTISWAIQSSFFTSPHHHWFYVCVTLCVHKVEETDFNKNGQNWCIRGSNILTFSPWYQSNSKNTES